MTTSSRSWVRRAFGAMAGLFPVLLVWASPCEAQQAPVSVEQFLNMKMLKSPSGRFIAYGTNSLEASDLARWADELAGRVDRALGAAPPAERPPVRLVLTRDSAATSGWAKVVSYAPALQILVANYETVNVADVERSLVSGLLADFATWGATSRADVVVAPAWLVTGVLRNANVEVRESDFASVLRAWQDASVPPLAECLAGLAGSSGTNAVLTGALVQWMMSLKPRDACLRKVLALSAGGASPRADWFYEFAGCSTPADLEGSWEKWLAGRQWMIGVTGGNGVWLLDLIRSERLIYAADSGIPNGKPGDPPVTFSDLIRERKTGWARTAASSRAVRLRLLSAGRAAEVSAVIEAYSRFLEAVHAGERESALKERLAEADRRFAALEARLTGKSGGDTRVAPSAASGDDRESK